MKKKKNKPIKIDSLAKKGGKFILIVALIIGLLMTVSFWVRVNFWFELPATYSSQLSVLMVALLMMFFAAVVHEGMARGWSFLRSVSVKSWLMLGVVLLTLTHAIILPVFTPVRATFDESARSKSDIRVMTINKYYDNQDYSQIIHYVNSRRPDVLAIEEVFHDEAELLAKEMGYEQWHMADCGCSAYGSDLALFSKFPLENVGLAFEDRLGGVLRGEVVLGANDRVVVYVVHIVVPYSPTAYEIRRDMLHKLAKSVNDETEKVIVMGDFNASPYSIDIRDLNESMVGLSIVSDSPWAQCSWHGYGGMLCARIDHIFVPDSSVVTALQIGPRIGSDHRSVDIDVKL